MKMGNTAIIIIRGAPILASANREYEWEHRQWEAECSGVRARFHKKTSRCKKGGKEYEYTNWYQETGSGLKSVGKEEPNYAGFYPPEPKPPYSFKAVEYDGHLMLEKKDYEGNLKLFKDCLVFELEDCKNFEHPLYKNPGRALKDKGSVRKPGVSSGRSAISEETENEDMCRGDGDCDECEHQDECPVIAEG